MVALRAKKERARRGLTPTFRVKPTAFHDSWASERNFSLRLEDKLTFYIVYKFLAGTLLLGA